MTQARNREGLLCSLIQVRTGHSYRGQSVFYCSNRADYDCKKCNGVCGPKDGCHCKACEELTLFNKKKVVNSELNKVMVSFDINVKRYRYYCGRSGVCDPIQLIQCGACLAMDSIPIVRLFDFLTNIFPDTNEKCRAFQNPAKVL